MADYQEFKNAMEALEAFIEKTETKEIDGEVHITIDDNNVEEFKEIIYALNAVASSEDNYIDDVMEYLNELDQRLTDKNMIAKFIITFSGMHCLAEELIAARQIIQQLLEGKTSEIPDEFKTIGEPRLDDWVFEMTNLNAKPWERFGKIVDISTNEQGVVTYKIKAPVENNEILEWEEGGFVVVRGMEKMLKAYQEKYSKIF